MNSLKSSHCHPVTLRYGGVITGFQTRTPGTWVVMFAALVASMEEVRLLIERYANEGDKASSEVPGRMFQN